MLSILALFFVLIENSIPTSSMILSVSLPFISYSIKKGNWNFLYIVFVYIFVSVQTDRYFYIFLVILIYVLISILLLSYIEYNRKTMFYILIVQIIFYCLLTLKSLNIGYLIFNICGFIVFNYIFTKNIEIKGK